MVSVSVCFAASASARPGTGGPRGHCNAEATLPCMCVPARTWCLWDLHHNRGGARVQGAEDREEKLRRQAVDVDDAWQRLCA